MTHDCTEEIRVSLYHDGELDAEQSGRMKAHLDGCGACGGSLRDLRMISEGIGRLPLGEITSAEQARIHQAVRHAEMGLGERAVLQLGYALAALAASMLVVSSLWLADNISGRSRQREASVDGPDVQLVAPSLGADIRLSAYMVRGLGRDDHP